MFNFLKKSTFKLYRYYLKKIFLTWLFLTILTLVLIGFSRWFPWGFKYPPENEWGSLWLYSLIRTGILFQVSLNLIFLLVSKAKTEDSWILTTISPINRQSIMVAKLASFFTYYSVSCLFFTKFSAFTNPLYLLFDWAVLILVNFGLFLIPLFYLYFPARSKALKFLVFFFYLAIPLRFAYLNPSLFKETFMDSPLVPILLSVFVGSFFLYLFWENFRQYDY